MTVVAGSLLAAGKSRRTGVTYKHILVIRTETLSRHTMLRLQASRRKERAVVLVHDAGKNRTLAVGIGCSRRT